MIQTPLSQRFIIIFLSLCNLTSSLNQTRNLFFWNVTVYFISVPWVSNFGFNCTQECTQTCGVLCFLGRLLFCVLNMVWIKSSVSLSVKNLVQSMLLTNARKSTKTWVMSSFRGRIANVSPRFRRSSMSFVSITLE